jgi:protein-L-isoaspartate(D-aspartate) O-methyltransferase
VDSVGGLVTRVRALSASLVALRRRKLPRTSEVCDGLPLFSKGLVRVFGELAKNHWAKETLETRLQILAPRFDSGRGLQPLQPGTATVPYRGHEPWGAHISAETLQDRRLSMVNGQLRTGGIVDQAVLAAFLSTPRERFVAPAFASLAYLDRELPALGAKARRLLAPMTLGRMLQAAVVNPGERALDVGGGSGYGAALLDLMGAKVVLLESDAGAAAAARTELVGRANIVVVESPLASGAAELGPFDLIVLEGAFQVSPDRLIALLADPGRLVGIDASSGAPQAVIYEKSGGALGRRALFETSADTLDGFRPEMSFTF